MKVIVVTGHVFDAFDDPNAPIDPLTPVGGLKTIDLVECERCYALVLRGHHFAHSRYCEDVVTR